MIKRFRRMGCRHAAISWIVLKYDKMWRSEAKKVSYALNLSHTFLNRAQICLAGHFESQLKSWVKLTQVDL